jgi:hypothetical protein
MKKLLLLSFLIFTALGFTACVNKHGISAKYYSDCKEYYDMQGYYHKECGEDDIVTYKQITDETKSVINEAIHAYKGTQETQKGNVW